MSPGGPPQVLCDAGIEGGGGTWNRDGVILFGADSGPIQRVQASGGACTPDPKTEGASFHRFPIFLPDGKHFLYLVDWGEEAKRGVYLAALDNPEGHRILADRSSVVFAPRAAGGQHDYLLFLRGANLKAQPFDTGTLQLAGDAFAVAADESFSYTTGQMAAAASGDGMLVLSGQLGQLIPRLSAHLVRPVRQGSGQGGAARRSGGSFGLPRPTRPAPSTG